MIVPKGWQILRMLGFIGRTLIVLFVFDVIVAVAYLYYGQRQIALPHLPLSIGAGVIGVILGFRNNSSYARWWEARTLWGDVTTYSRCLGRQGVAFLSGADEPEEQKGVDAARRRLLYYQIAYVNALRCQLRDETPSSALDLFLTEEEIDSLRGERNVAAEIQQRMGLLLDESFRRGWLAEVHLGLLDNSLTALANAQGGCERIKHTPVPKDYDYFLRLVVFGQCLLLPLGMVANLGLFTPIGASLLGFVFLALERIGRDLEHPFCHSRHDVPMTAICRTIEINLKQSLGETEFPAPIKPVRGILW